MMLHPPHLAQEMTAAPDIEAAARHALDEGDDVSGLSFEGGTLAGLAGKKLEFCGCRIRHATFGENELAHLCFTDCIVESTEFLDLHAYESSLYRCEFIRCRAAGAIFDKAVFADVRFDDCQLAFLSLAHTKLTRVKFEKSNLESLSLLECILKETSFDHSRLSRAEIARTSLKDIDFSSCAIDGMAVPVELLHGATVSAAQTVQIAQALGIHVAEMQ